MDRRINLRSFVIVEFSMDVLCRLDKKSLAMIGNNLAGACHNKRQWEQASKILSKLHKLSIHYCNYPGPKQQEMWILAMEIYMHNEEPEKAAQILERKSFGFHLLFSVSRSRPCAERIHMYIALFMCQYVCTYMYMYIAVFKF